MDQKTIMIVEDELGIRQMTEMYLVQQGYNVIAAKHGKEALELLQTTNPNLILLDIEMPEMDGFTTCEEIRKQRNVPIIFLTVRREMFDKIKCFELGGDDYITKPFDFEELHARIKANIRRYETYSFTNENILKYGTLEIHLHNFDCYIDGKQLQLSTKETELLIYLAKHPNQVLSSEQLYDQIWSFEASGNVDTVKVHISHLRRKIEKDHTNPQFIITVRGFGYRFNG